MNLIGLKPDQPRNRHIIRLRPFPEIGLAGGLLNAHRLFLLIFLLRAIFASALVYAETVLGTASLNTNCPLRRQTIRPASLRIFRWWETVAGVTFRMETISPQFIWPAREMASKILSRVSSAKAFDIFSITGRFIGGCKV